MADHRVGQIGDEPAEPVELMLEIGKPPARRLPDGQKRLLDRLVDLPERIATPTHKTGVIVVEPEITPLMVTPGIADLRIDRRRAGKPQIGLFPGGIPTRFLEPVELVHP